jgi:PAS domain S-box-containing protein
MPAEPPSPFADPSLGDTAGPAKILLVDDRPDKLIALTAVLSELGQELITAHSGKEALRLILANDFAVILLDVSMPVMDGFETASLIRQRKNSEHTPIIFITALNASENHASRGYSLGAVDYIYAPVIPEVLRAKVSVFVDLFNKTRAVHQQSERLRVEAERRADHLESRLESLLNRLNVGIFRSTLAGNLISANPAFMRIFAINPQVDPRTINMSQFYVQEGDRRAITRQLEAEGRVQEWHVLNRRLDGTQIWTSISKTLLEGADGETYVDGLLEDITVRKEAETALIAKAEELARSNAELEEFAYVASHDLQEPLRMVSSYASLLRARYSASIDARGQGFLDEVAGSAKRMQDLIRGILSFSRIGKEVEATEVDCNEVLDRVLFNLAHTISENRAKIIRSPLPRLRGDAVLIGQVFQNLIGNSLKFKRKDVPPEIHVAAEERNGWWHLSISDNGIGIAPDCRERVFQLFQRLHTRSEYEGTGMGLAICRKAVRHHGGDITIDPLPREGTSFRFWLPSAASDDRQASTGIATASHSD